MPDNPIQLSVELLDLHAAQQIVVESMARFRVCVAGRRWGKTEVAIDEIANCLIDGQSVAYFTPTWKMGAEVWRLLVQILGPITTYKNESDRRLVTLTGGILECWSIQQAFTIRGRKYHLLVVDEAAFIANGGYIWETVLRPLITDYIGRVLFLSTPQSKNWFYHLYLMGQDPLKQEWASWRFPTSTNPYIDPNEIESARNELQDMVFRQEYLAEFGDIAGQVFRNIEALADLMPSKPYRGNFSFGIDWAQNEDYTVIKILDIDQNIEVFSDRFHRVKWSVQRGRVKALYEVWKPSVIVVELNSIGGPQFEELENDGLPVVGFTTTSKSKGPLVESLALAFEKEELRIINDPVTKGELDVFERKVNPNTYRSSYSAPLGLHDDTVISLALAWHGKEVNPHLLLDNVPSELLDYRGPI